MIELYQHRSYARCISEGYKFLADHLWLTFKVMGPYFLAVSMIAVLWNGVNTHANVAILAGQQIYLEEIIADFALIALLVVAYVFTLRRMYIMFKRITKAPVPGGASATTATSGPVHRGTASMLSIIKKVSKALFHHFWKILGTTLLSLFLLVVLSAIAYLPYVVSSFSYFGSVEGQINFGDTALIPLSGYILIFFCCTLSYFIINMFSVAFYATEMYLYGSIRSTDAKA